MRIIAGKYRGRFLESPPEKITRPTIDRVREAAFSSLTSIRCTFEDAHVLDLFAGSGAMALEAISRGANFANLIERNATAIKIIRKNISALEIPEGRVHAQQADVFTHIPDTFNNCGFDVIFIDPPYAYEPSQIFTLIQKLRALKIISEHAIYLYEHDSTTTKAVDEAFTASEISTYISLIKRKKYGRVVLDIMN